MKSQEGHLLEHLLWVMGGPSLLSESSAPIIADSECAALLHATSAQWSRLEVDSTPLEQFVRTHRKSGRLGNLFEVLVQYWLERLIGVDDLLAGLPIRHGGETRGELDFVFRAKGQSSAPIEHWEVAVKFFMCIAPSPELATSAETFVGQALADRLDRKVALSLQKQLPIVRTPEAEKVLNQIGFSGPIRSRLFFKGRLFYPLSWNWRDVSPPAMVSPRHERGWWMAWHGEASSKALASADRQSFGDSNPRGWVVLGKDRWMARVREAADSLEVLGDQQLQSTLDQHFASSTSAVQLARVERSSTGAWCEPDFGAGMGRGMILMPGWPQSVESVRLHQ